MRSYNHAFLSAILVFVALIPIPHASAYADAAVWAGAVVFGLCAVIDAVKGR